MVGRHACLSPAALLDVQKPRTGDQMCNGTLIYSWSLIYSRLSLDMVSLSMVRQSRRDSLQGLTRC
jgi:hypothetical protein